MNRIDEKKETPPLIEGKNYSETVIAICDGKLHTMRYCFIDSRDEDESGYVWANTYGELDGDAYFDDEYNVTHWQPFPKVPGIINPEKTNP